MLKFKNVRRKSQIGTDKHLDFLHIIATVLEHMLQKLCGS